MVVHGEKLLSSLGKVRCCVGISVVTFSPPRYLHCFCFFCYWHTIVEYPFLSLGIAIPCMAYIQVSYRYILPFVSEGPHIICFLSYKQITTEPPTVHFSDSFISSKSIMIFPPCYYQMLASVEALMGQVGGYKDGGIDGKHVWCVEKGLPTATLQRQKSLFHTSFHSNT